MRLWLALLFIGFAGLVQAQDHGETRRYFNDWLGACRTDGYCSAISYVNPSPGDGRVADYWFRIGRHARGTYWELSFTPIKVMADPAQPFSLAVDGAPEVFAGAAEIAPYGAINDYFLLGSKAQLVMDRLMPGGTLTVNFTDEAGAPTATRFSLNGLTAALIWIDEQQKRLGSERVAEAPPEGLAPALRHAADTVVPQQLLDRLAADPECRPLAELANGTEIIVDPALDTASRLYVLPCWDAAYNFGSKVFVEQAGDFSAMYFAEFSPADGWTGSSFLVNAGYDPAAKELTSLYKGRGSGECGTSGRWRWQGYQFRLVEFAARDDCDSGATGDFPVVYPAPLTAPAG